MDVQREILAVSSIEPGATALHLTVWILGAPSLF